MEEKTATNRKLETSTNDYLLTGAVFSGSRVASSPVDLDFLDTRNKSWNADVTKDVGTAESPKRTRGLDWRC